jgi:hypothetical protein
MAMDLCQIDLGEISITVFQKCLITDPGTVALGSMMGCSAHMQGSPHGATKINIYSFFTSQPCENPP